MHLVGSYTYCRMMHGEYSVKALTTIHRDRDRDRDRERERAGREVFRGKHYTEFDRILTTDVFKTKYTKFVTFSY